MALVFREPTYVNFAGGMAGFTEDLVLRQQLVFKWLTDVYAAAVESPPIKSLEDELDDMLTTPIRFSLTDPHKYFDAWFVRYDAERRILLFNSSVDLAAERRKTPDYLKTMPDQIVYLVLSADTPDTVTIVAPDAADMDWWPTDHRDGNRLLPAEVCNRIIAIAQQ